MTVSDKLRAYADELPGALMLAVLTAVTTILLILVLSAVLGAENRALQEQAVFNGEEVVDHAIVARCEMAYIVELLKEIGAQSESLDLTQYPNINVEGLDCEAVITEPFRVGNDFGLEGQ